MDDNRTCPHCGGTIKAQARLCKHCREPLSDGDATPDQPRDDFDNPISRFWASTGAGSWVRRARTIHLIGVSVYMGLGLVALTRSEIVLGGVGLLSSALMIYLFASIVSRALKVNYTQGAAGVAGLFDIVELAIVTLLLANASGFWMGLSDAILEHRADQTRFLYAVSTISFSSLFFISIALVTALGVTQTAYHVARREGSS